MVASSLNETAQLAVTGRGAARLLRCSPRTIREARRLGELVPVRLGERWERFLVTDLIAWARTKQSRPTPHAVTRMAEVLKREGRASGTSTP